MRKAKYIFLITLLFSISGLLKAQGTEGPMDPILNDEGGRNNPIWSALPDMQYGSTRDFIPVSPRAASLGVFGQIPVGNYTGTAEVNVPLYVIMYKELSVPISLNYHASGVKPDLFPGPVGLGWALQCGGVITRVVRGTPDYGPPPVNESAGSGEITMVEDPRGNQNWSSESFLKEYIINDYLVDGKSNPDEFYFNINGHSGRFYIDHTDTFRIQSTSGEVFFINQITKGGLSGEFARLPQTIKRASWERDYDPYVQFERIISGFEMIDTKGIKYVFGKSINAIEFSRPGFNGYIDNYSPDNYIQPMSWFLISIESPNGYKIDFTYEKETYITKNRFTDYGKMIINGTSKSLTGARTVDGLKANMINGCYLKEITFPLGKISFQNSIASEQLDYDDKSIFYPHNSIKVGNPDTYMDDGANTDYYTRFEDYNDVHRANTKKLYGKAFSVEDTDSVVVRNRFIPHKVDGFEVFDANGQRIKKIEFKYTKDKEIRLKLLTVDLYGKTNDEKQQYSFEYNKRKMSFYLRVAGDHYGFDNSNFLLDPNFENTIKNNPDIFSSLKRPDPSLCSSEMLEKIIYPTKGYTLLEYEAHEYGSQYKTWPFRVEANTNGNQLTGGPRIKRVLNYDSDGTKLKEKIYHYKKNYLAGGTTSSGVLAYVPKYSEKYKTVILKKSTTAPQQFSIGEFFRASSNPIYPMMSIRGNHVTYSEVTVEEPGNGYTVYKYKNYDNGYADKPLITQASTIVTASDIPVDYTKNDEGISMKIERGQIISQEVFDQNKKRKNKTEYLYNDNPNRFNENVRKIELLRNGIDFSDQQRSYRINAGVIYTYFPYLREKRDTIFLHDKKLITHQTFTYDNQYRFIRSVKTKDSYDKEVQSTVAYPHNQATANNIYKKMTNKYMLNYPVEKILYNDNSLISKTSFIFAENLSSLPNSILPHQQKVQYGNAPAFIESTITKYDKYNNPVNIISKDNFSTCILWSYKGQYPVAEIKNASYAAVNTALSAIGISSIDALAQGNGDSRLHELRNQDTLKDAYITIYKYEPLIGVTEVTGPTGITSIYEYDPLGRLKETYLMEEGVKKNIQSYEYHYQNQ
jgi:hypothetical protein